MSDIDDLNHTNDVPIVSIKRRSPALWGLLSRNLSEAECKLVDDFFLIAVECGGNAESIEREQGVTFNARLARVIQIAADATPLTVTLALKCLSACCPAPDRFLAAVQSQLPNQPALHAPLQQVDELNIVAQGAVLLDDLRHLHLTGNTNEQIRSCLQEADRLQKKLQTINSKKLDMLIDAAIQRAQRLL